MTDQQEQSAPGRFLEYFQQSIGSIAIHLLSAVDNDDAPPLLRRGQPKEAGDLARVLDDDLAAQAPASGIIGSLHREQVSVSPRCDPAKDAACRIGCQPATRRAAECASRNIRRFREQKPSEPEGER